MPDVQRVWGKRMGARSFRAANREFEAWLPLRCDVVEDDLAFKHFRMKKSAFVFLRATCFRWAMTIESLCPELATAPAVLSVGDAHIENFGSWRDREGRLVWGANDFDEAARMPYPCDLVRLAASAFLAPDGPTAHDKVASAILEGYVEGLTRPSPMVLGENWQWLLDWLEVSGSAHEKFWREIEELPDADPPAQVKRALQQGLPGKATALRFATRRAGGGGLGRPRYVAIAEWRGGRVVREAKALVPSAWDWAHGRSRAAPQFMRFANAHRASDPYLRQRGNFVVRRLAADAKKA